MANDYIHNSKLDALQVRDIIRSYSLFVPPKMVAAKAGLSRQTIRSLYWQLSQRLFAERMLERVPPEHPRRQHEQRLVWREARSAFEYYQMGRYYYDINFEVLNEIDTDDSTQERFELGVATQLRDQWGKISERAFPFHFALIQRTTEYRIIWALRLGAKGPFNADVMESASRQIAKEMAASLLKAPLGGRTARQKLKLLKFDDQPFNQYT